MELQPKVTSYGIENSPCITSDEYFMGIAMLLEKRSEKGCYPVGACIVNSDQRIVGTGYNTIYNGWNKKKDRFFRPLFLCHAEVAAIQNKTSTDLKGCTMYVTRFPCKCCAIEIILSDLKKVMYCDNRSHITKSVKTAKKLFAAYDVFYGECTTIYDKLAPKAYCKFSRLKNEECFMGIAYLSSKRSNNVEKNGACVVTNDNNIVSVGYNELSETMGNADFIINSLLNTSCDVKDCTMYITFFPCYENAEVIVQSGIKTVKYLCETIDDETEAAKEIFDAYSVKYIQFNVKISKIEIFKSYYRLDYSNRSYQNKKQVKEKPQKKAGKKKRRRRKKNQQT